MNAGSRVVAAAAALAMGFAGVVCLGQQGEQGLPKQSKPQLVAPGTDPLAAKPAGASSWPQDETVTADVKFNGGTVKEYVDALKAVYGDFNVVIDNNAMGVQTPEIRLTHVPKGEALKALELASLPDGRFPVISVESANAFYAVRARILPNETKNRGVDLTRVWALGQFVGDSLKPEDVLTAIDAALGVGGGKATVRYHKETQLLIVRGSVDSLSTVEEVVSRLGKERGSDWYKSISDRLSRVEEAMRLKAPAEAPAASEPKKGN